MQHSTSLGWLLTYIQASANLFNTVLLRSDGHCVACGHYFTGVPCKVPTLAPGLTYTSMSAGSKDTVFLRSDGRAMADGICVIPDLEQSTAFVQVSASSHTLFLRSDGEVMATGPNSAGQCNVPPLPHGLKHIDIAAGARHSVLLRLREGNDIPSVSMGQRYISAFAGMMCTVLLCSDGAAILCGSEDEQHPFGSEATCINQLNLPPLSKGLRYVAEAARNKDMVFQLGVDRSGDALSVFLIKSNTDDLNKLIALVKAGKLKVPVDSIVPFSDVQAVLSKSMGWASAGKLVIQVLSMLHVQPAAVPGWAAWGQMPRMAPMSGRAAGGAGSAPPGSRVVVKVTNPPKPPTRGHHSTSPSGPRIAHADGAVTQAMRANGVYTSSHSAVVAGSQGWPSTLAISTAMALRLLCLGRSVWRGLRGLRGTRWIHQSSFRASEFVPETVEDLLYRRGEKMGHGGGRFRRELEEVPQEQRRPGSATSCTDTFARSAAQE
eukprot:s342_g5.t1